MSLHDQVWVKVNAQVDIGIAEIVELLNRVDGLETLQSCQGIPGEAPAYVYFSCGDWQNVCRFVFDEVGPKLHERLDDEVRASVELLGGNAVGKLSFSAEAASLIASALKEVNSVQNPP